MNHGDLNDLWAECLIDQLVQLGVTQFFIAPGSRSTPLVIAVHNHPLAYNIVHFDERGLGFCALGFGKGMQKPAAIITTSGTAAGNLLPAIMEADQFHIPLIVITADRPYDQIDIGANQTTHQNGMFNNFVRYQISIPPPSFDEYSFLASTLAYAVHRSMSPLKGAVHLNCMFREPLFGNGTSPPALRPVTYLPSVPTLTLDSFQEIALLINPFSRGVVILGNDLAPDEAKEILQLAHHLKWVVLDDVLSTVRSKEHSYYYEFFLHLDLLEKPECVLHFGNRFVSKKLLQWIGKTPRYLVINTHDQRVDPSLTMTHAITCDPILFCQTLLPLVENKTDTAYLDSFKEINHRVRSQINLFFEEKAPLSESLLFHELNNLSPNDLALFLGTSMPVRDGNALLFPKEGSFEIFSNRGVSGIDGNIATACGLALALKKPLIALIGDQTALHDLNSLALIHEIKTPILFLIINNQGGTIFAHLPIASKTAVIDRYFIAQHDYDFKGGVEQFKIPYHHVSDLDFLQFPFTTGVIEICVDQDHSIQTRKKLFKTIEEGLLCTT